LAISISDRRINASTRASSAAKGFIRSKKAHHLYRKKKEHPLELHRRDAHVGCRDGALAPANGLLSGADGDVEAVLGRQVPERELGGGSEAHFFLHGAKGGNRDTGAYEHEGVVDAGDHRVLMQLAFARASFGDDGAHDEGVLGAGELQLQQLSVGVDEHRPLIGRLAAHRGLPYAEITVQAPSEGGIKGKAPTLLEAHEEREDHEVTRGHTSETKRVQRGAEIGLPDSGVDRHVANGGEMRQKRIHVESGRAEFDFETAWRIDVDQDVPNVVSFERHGKVVVETAAQLGLEGIVEDLGPEDAHSGVDVHGPVGALERPDPNLGRRVGADDRKAVATPQRKAQGVARH